MVNRALSCGQGSSQNKLEHCASQPEVTITVAFRVRVASPLSSSRGGGGGVTLGAIYVRRFLREKRSSVNLRVFYAQFTLRSPHSCIYLGPGGAIKSAINHLNIGPGLREGESLRLPGPASI